jgi:flagellar basal body-associated protein FliL
MTQDAPTKSQSTLLVTVVVCLAAAAGGFAVPMFLGGPRAKGEKAPTENAEAQPALVSFGEPVIVNLAEERLSRYLRVRLMLVIEPAEEKAVSERLQKKKSFLRSWLLSYLSDQTVQGIIGGSGQNRIRREIRDQFNAMLFPDGAEKIIDILFEEFNVQ